MSIPSETPRSTSQKRSLPQMMSAIGARLAQVRSTDGGDSLSVANTLVDKPDSIADDRSVSRGRDAFLSSGRGGAGNIRRSSVSRDARPPVGDFSPARGRELAVHPERAQVVSVGRGGAGNIHSPSRDAPRNTLSIMEDAAETNLQARVVQEHAEATAVHSSGRGGSGNISGSRSRSRGSAIMHSSGRGGAGNIHANTPINPEALDEEERKRHAHHEGIHSTGRGGAANITAVHEPDVERVAHHHLHGEFESTGRGGAGNIRTHSPSRDPAARATSKDKHGIAAIFDKFSHSHHHLHVANEPGVGPNEGSTDASH